MLSSSMLKIVELLQNDIQYFNNVRVTLKTKGMTLIEFQNHTLVA